MSQVVSFEDYVPSPRYDGIAWTQARIEESVSSTGPWTAIETITLSPVDADPSLPATRNLTTELATDAPDLWYRIVFLDADGDSLAPSDPVQNSGISEPDTDSFITRGELQIMLGYDLEDDKADIAVHAACDAIRQTVGQSLNFVEDDVAVLDSDGMDTLLLPELPVYSVTSLVGPGGSALTEGTNFVLDTEAGLLQTKSLTSKFLKGRQIYTVTYSHGYVQDSSAAGLPSGVLEWPYSLKLLALQLASRIYDQGIVSSESVGGVSMSYAAPEAIVLTDRERSLLEKAVGVGRRR